jgi:hypothetical protein
MTCLNFIFVGLAGLHDPSTDSDKLKRDEDKNHLILQLISGSIMTAMILYTGCIYPYVKGTPKPLMVKINIMVTTGIGLIIYVQIFSYIFKITERNAEKKAKANISASSASTEAAPQDSPTETPTSS